MNNEEYIASGMLELYAAGALTQEEQQEVEHMAANSAEVRAALLEACATMEEYAHLHAVKPRPELKGRVLQQITAQQPAMVEEPAVVEEVETPVRPMYADLEKEGSPYKWMFAASIVLFLLSGFMSFRFYQNWKDAESRLAVALASEQTLAQNYNTAAYKMEQQEQLLGIMRNDSFRPVKLKGVAAHPEAAVMVYYNPERRQVYLDVLQLPAPPAGKQYQLWALDQGKPVNAGMIAMGKTRESILQQMKEIGSAQAFAITLEPAGGSVNPTMDQMYVMGEINS
ncbi:anti-sigma factor [Pontibacter sp. MBLB2868]|uniref:anti-sigma factor n=1 Tax=Pontibacter sp. MBLB2868 TaxID=3451555 RepID=UPI003F756520